ncbi:calcium-binding outer membrane-like protein [Vibrio harveyi]|nr:calcium-binding outer membrane-like protein [Vibrio harveyi]
MPVDGIVSVPAGMTQFDVRIASIDDEVYEGPENFTVDVTGLGPVQGTDTAQPLSSMMVRGQSLSQMMTVRRYLSVTLARLMKVTPLTLLYH